MEKGMTEPLISVKMITYNHAPYIAAAIDGVLAQQTEFPWELVIGEDCSCDGTRRIVLEYARKHPQTIRVITSEKNVGMSANAGRVLKACQGKYIAWCEGDDSWHRPDKLQRQVSYLEGHPDCGLVHSDIDYVEVRTGKRIPCYNRERGITPPENPTLSGLIHGRWGVRTCTAVARLDMVRDIWLSDYELYQSGRFLLGDKPLWAEILFRSGMHYFDESLATLRILAESASHSQSESRQQRFYVSCAEMNVYLARKLKLPACELKSFEQSFLDAKLLQAFIDLDKRLAEEAWKSLARRTLRRRLLSWGARVKVLNRLIRTAWCWKNRIRGVIAPKAAEARPPIPCPCERIGASPK
jgi:glycosyltransferase involved in cell wall biosynthesis